MAPSNNCPGLCYRYHWLDRSLPMLFHSLHGTWDAAVFWISARKHGATMLTKWNQWAFSSRVLQVSKNLAKSCEKEQRTFSINRCLFWCFSDGHLFISSASRNWLLDAIFQLPDFTIIFHDRKKKHLCPILCIGMSSYWLWWIAGLPYVLRSYPQQSHSQWRHTQRSHPSLW